MANFEGRRGDLKWGVYDYPVTNTQKISLDGLWHMMGGNGPYSETPKGGYYSQDSSNGDIVIGMDHRSVRVHRSGRVTSNRE